MKTEENEMCEVRLDFFHKGNEGFSFYSKLDYLDILSMRNIISSGYPIRGDFSWSPELRITKNVFELCSVGEQVNLENKTYYVLVFRVRESLNSSDLLQGFDIIQRLGVIGNTSVIKTLTFNPQNYEVDNPIPIILLHFEFLPATPKPIEVSYEK